MIQKLSKKIYKILDLKGFSRSDFILRNNNFYFLEINTNPGLTKESILPQQAISYGISLKELFKELDVDDISTFLKVIFPNAFG